MFLHNLLTSSEIQIVCIKILEKNQGVLGHHVTNKTHNLRHIKKLLMDPNDFMCLIYIRSFGIVTDDQLNASTHSIVVVFIDRDEKS